MAAVQRMYFPVETDVPTGSIDVRQLRAWRCRAWLRRAGLAAAARRLLIGWPGATGRSRLSGLIEPSSFSSAYSTSDFHDSAVRSSSRSRGKRGCGRTVLKPTDEEEVGRREAARRSPSLVAVAELRVAERLDRLDAALGEVAGDALDEHAAQPAAGERGDHVGGHQQHRVGRDRARWGRPSTAGTYAGGAYMTNPAGMPST